MTKINSSYLTTLDTNLAAQVVADPEALQNVVDNFGNVINLNSPEGQYAADAGSTDAYAVTLSPVPTAYFTGMTVRFKANTANTGTATLNVNALGAKTIKKSASSDLGTGDILSNQILAVIYDGTNFQLLSVPSNLANKTQEAWIGTTLLNSWLNWGAPYANATYYKDEINMVQVRATLKSGVVTANTAIMTLPAGYRPSAQLVRNAFCYNGTSYLACSVEIKTNGEVVTGSNVANNFLAMDFSFRAE